MLHLDDFINTTDDEFIKKVSDELLDRGGLTEEELDSNMMIAWNAREYLLGRIEPCPVNLN